MLDQLVQEKPRIVLISGPAVSGARGEGKIEVLAQEHELFRQHHRGLEGNDAVLHPVNDEQMILQRFAVVNGRDATVDLRVRMRESHEGDIVRPKKPGVDGGSAGDTGLEETRLPKERHHGQRAPVAAAPYADPVRIDELECLEILHGALQIFDVSATDVLVKGFPKARP